jgi:NAD(P)-dependent dehydrogenase (short-subunit alcohol dehydrogenase family)
MTDRGSVVLTGASTGIGEACARRLDAEGFRVFAGVRRVEDGRRLQGVASRLVPVMLDVTDVKSIEDAAAAVDAEVGAAGLAGVVNNAGVAVSGPLEHLPLALLRHQLEVNVTGQVAVTQAFLPLLRRARGRLVFMGSISGRIAAPLLGPYSASKFAIEAICDALRLELSPWGLDVVLVEPGEIATPIWEKGLAEGDALTARMPEIGRQRYGPLIAAIRRLAEKAAREGSSPGTVADAVLHALTAPRPNTRYLVGTDAKLRAWVARLPDRWRDRIIARSLQLAARADESVSSAPRG